VTPWQRLNGPRTKREQRVAKIAGDLERNRVLALWEEEMKCPCEEPMQHLASLIKGEN
jgi:hypothetical protein